MAEIPTRTEFELRRIARALEKLVQQGSPAGVEVISARIYGANENTDDGCSWAPDPGCSKVGVSKLVWALANGGKEVPAERGLFLIRSDAGPQGELVDVTSKKMVTVVASHVALTFDQETGDPRKPGSYLVRVNLAQPDPNTWDWRDWRVLRA